DTEAAATVAGQTIWVGVGAAALCGVLGIAFAPAILAIMGGDEAVIAIGTTYTRLMLGGSATILLLFLLNAIFRGAGSAALAMRVLWLANGINIVLCPVF